MAGRTIAGEARIKPYKLTVSLDPGVYDGLRDWAHQERLSHQAVLEGLVNLLLNSPSVAAEVRSSVHR